MNIETENGVKMVVSAVLAAVATWIIMSGITASANTAQVKLVQTATTSSASSLGV